MNILIHYDNQIIFYLSKQSIWYRSDKKLIIYCKLWDYFHYTFKQHVLNFKKFKKLLINWIIISLIKLFIYLIELYII